MDILCVLIPLSVVLAVVVLAGLWWAVYRGQCEDIEEEGRRIFEEDKE
jgi:cbb3-type cytochrome oxidase maturation protein